jgi:hypothetical protein
MAKSKHSELNLQLHPRQADAFNSLGTEVLFGGGSRGGKSYMCRVALIVWATQIPGLQCFIFRKHYDDVIGNHMLGPGGFKQLLAPWIRDGIVTCTETEVRWNQTGSLISLEHIGHENDLEKHQGREKHVLVLDEATQIPERFIRFLRAWVTMPADMVSRLPPEYKGRFPKIIYTANPFGVSAGYFRNNFVKARRPYEIERAPDDDGGFLRQYIPALVTDNPSEDPEAARRRIAGIGNASLTEALISGNWDAPGGDYFREYRDGFAPHGHVLQAFTTPGHWFKFRTFDWGGREPFAVYWWAVADGEPFPADDNTRLWVPRGSLIAYREWYGCNAERSAEGLQMRNELIAEGILNRTLEPTSGLTFTDSLPFQDRGFSKNNRRHTIADAFFEAGVPLTLGNTARIQGWSQMRDRLLGQDGMPLIYFDERCQYARDYVPSLGTHKRNPEDAEDSGEATHACDAIRLACTCRPLVVEAPKPATAEIPRRRLPTTAEIVRKLGRSDSDADYRR